MTSRASLISQFEDLPSRPSLLVDLSALIDVMTSGQTHLRKALLSDAPAIEAIENTLFPGSVALFEISCIHRLLSLFQGGIVVADNCGSIEGYVSLLPLSRAATSYILKNRLKKICNLPPNLLKSRNEQWTCLFIEVIAIHPECPKSIQFAIRRFFLELVCAFRTVPKIACPISEVGLVALIRHGFVPFENSGLNEIYINIGGNML